MWKKSLLCPCQENPLCVSCSGTGLAYLPEELPVFGNLVPQGPTSTDSFLFSPLNLNLNFDRGDRLTPQVYYTSSFRETIPRERPNLLYPPEKLESLCVIHQDSGKIQFLQSGQDFSLEGKSILFYDPNSIPDHFSVIYQANPIFHLSGNKKSLSPPFEHSFAFEAFPNQLPEDSPVPEIAEEVF